MPAPGRPALRCPDRLRRIYNYATAVAGKKDERTVFVFDKFTIPADKMRMGWIRKTSGGGGHMYCSMAGEMCIFISPFPSA